MYFKDPNGVTLEFACWTRALDENDARHAPARQPKVKAGARIRTADLLITNGRRKSRKRPSNSTCSAQNCESPQIRLYDGFQRFAVLLIRPLAPLLTPAADPAWQAALEPWDSACYPQAA